MKLKIRTLCEIPLFVSLMTICAWLSIPSPIPFTLQTFAFFLCCLCLGGKMAFVCTTVYLFLGIVGVPVFSSFGAGIGIVLGTSGGFLVGLLPASLTYYIFTILFGNKDFFKVIGCVAGLFICYIFGAVWYIFIYLSTPTTIFTPVLTCILPFVIPDGVKLFLAYLVYTRIRKTLSIKNL